MVATATSYTWLEQKKAEAKTAYETLSWPDPKSEAYRRSDLSFLRNGFKPNTQAFQVEIPKDSLHITPFSKALETQPEILEQYLFKTIPCDQGKLESLQSALFEDGILIYIPAGTKLKEPITSIAHFASQEPDASFFPRTLIVLGEGAEATVIQEHIGETAHVALWNHGVEIILEKDAELTYIAKQKLGPQCRSFTYEAAHLAQNAKLKIFHLETGSRLHRIETTTDCAGIGAEIEVIGSVTGNSDQVFDAHILNRHQAAQTRSDMLWKSALRGKSKSSFLGTIQILRQANGSQAFQACHNLLLSKTASANPDPRLEIWANDVQAKHAATVGYLDPEQKFYLESRGMEEALAEKLIASGFLKETAARLDMSLRDTLETEIEETLL